MKLRIRSNSVRLRLGPREVQSLLQNGSLVETVRFGAGDTQALRYRLVLSSTGAPMSAQIKDFEITISISRSVTQAWAEDDGLTIVGEQSVGNDQTLKILVEKDLQCLESTAEPEQDVYPNPSATCI